MYCKVIILLILCKNVLPANILHISPVSSPSHHIWNRALAFGLVEKGHNVTLVGPDEDRVPPKNYSHILFEGLYELHDEFEWSEMSTLSGFEMIRTMYDLGRYMSEKIFKSKGLRTLLNYPKDFKFDLILYDVTAGYSLHPIITRFNNPPCIAVTPFLLPPYISHDFGNPLNPSYLPWYGHQYSDDMSFTQRLRNFIFTYLDVGSRYISNSYMDASDELIRKDFGIDQQSSWSDLQKHISLVLANTDPILDYPQPMPPNIIPVGGLHTRPSKELPEDLKTVADKAKNGIILFSLGSNIRSDKLGESTIKALLEAFGRLKETVIWKFESDLPNLPRNVIIKKWLPQNDLLGHPNVKLFIGHGGALSTQEAVFHGVPMICIPFLMDQFTNAKIIVKRKWGIRVDLAEITSNTMFEKINEILQNPEYKDNMQKSSDRFRNRLETPLERAIFWTEYVLRHEGAHFLEPKAKEMSFYTSSGADVITFIVVSILAILAIIYKIFVKIFKLISYPKQKVKTY